MKKCPNCGVDYFDNMLEFCLEDGSKLTLVSETVVTERTATRATAADTIAIPHVVGEVGVGTARKDEVETVVVKKDEAIEKVENGQASKVLEVAPIVLALAHNWWQWLYLENQYMSSLVSYIFSVNFFMWVVLLTAGVGTSLLALKNAQKRAFAYAGFVVMAINLILFLVPRK